MNNKLQSASNLNRSKALVIFQCFALIFSLISCSNMMNDADTPPEMSHNREVTRISFPASNRWSLSKKYFELNTTEEQYAVYFSAPVTSLSDSIYIFSFDTDFTDQEGNDFFNRTFGTNVITTGSLFGEGAYTGQDAQGGTLINRNYNDWIPGEDQSFGLWVYLPQSVFEYSNPNTNKMCNMVLRGSEGLNFLSINPCAGKIYIDIRPSASISWISQNSLIQGWNHVGLFYRGSDSRVTLMINGVSEEFTPDVSWVTISTPDSGSGLFLYCNVGGWPAAVTIDDFITAKNFLIPPEIIKEYYLSKKDWSQFNYGDPQVNGRKSVEVPLYRDDMTAPEIAAAVYESLQSLNDLSVTVEGNRITVTSTSAGEVKDAADYSSGATIEVTVQGD